MKINFKKLCYLINKIMIYVRKKLSTQILLSLNPYLGMMLLLSDMFSSFLVD